MKEATDSYADMLICRVLGAMGDELWHVKGEAAPLLPKNLIESPIKEDRK